MIHFKSGSLVGTTFFGEKDGVFWVTLRFDFVAKKIKPKLFVSFGFVCRMALEPPGLELKRSRSLLDQKKIPQLKRACFVLFFPVFVCSLRFCVQ